MVHIMYSCIDKSLDLPNNIYLLHIFVIYKKLMDFFLNKAMSLILELAVLMGFLLFDKTYCVQG